MSNATHLWYLMNATHGAYNGRKTAMTAQHARRWPGNVFSEVLNDAGTQSLVKLDSVLATQDEIDATDNSPATLIKYTPATHGQALTLLAGTEWSNTRTT